MARCSREKQDAELRAAPESQDDASLTGRPSEDSTASHPCDGDTSAGLLPSRHFRHPRGKRMPRGDSLLFEVADAIPLAAAPELIVRHPQSVNEIASQWYSYDSENVTAWEVRGQECCASSRLVNLLP